MKKISWWYTEFGTAEREALLQAFDAKSLTTGRFTQELEQSFAKALGVPYVVATNSGTSALTMALLALDIKPGDEILVPNITWIATAQAGAMLGAHVIPVETLPDRPVMDLKDLQRRITSKTKVIMPVHMNGRNSHALEIKALAQSKGIAFVEDTCKAMFSRIPEGFLGTFGDMGCFSMGMISLVPACYGGFVVTRDAALYERLKVHRWHGVEQGPPPLEEEHYTYLASNYKYSDLFASMGLSHFHKREANIQKLIALYKRYEQGLKGLDFIDMVEVRVDTGEVPLLIDVRSRHREKLRMYLKEHGIGTCNFHPPLHLAKYLKGTGSYDASTALARESFHLPCGPSQTLEDVDFVIDRVRKFKP